MGGQRGQASLEYVGVALVVAVVLGAVAVPLGAGRDVAGGVVRQVQRALCVVRSGDCEEDRRPCVTAAHGIEDAGYLDLAVLRVGARELVLREERSDGSVAVTFGREREGGLDVASGTEAHGRLGRWRLHAGVELDATLLASLGEGTTWVVRGAGEADRLVRQLVVDGPGDLGDRVLRAGANLDRFPRPAQTFGGHGLSVELGGTLGGEARNAALTLSSADLAGASTDLASGRRTFLVRRRNELAGSLTWGGRERGQGAAGTDEAYTVTLDGSGRPVDLGVLEGHDLRGRADLPRVLREVAGELDLPPAGARRWEVERHLDLTDASDLALARTFLAQVVAPRPRLGHAVEVSEALRRRLDDAAIVDARVLALDRSASGVEAGGHVGGLGLSSGYTRTHERQRLLSAVQRGRDRLWRRRGDCVGEAAT